MSRTGKIHAAKLENSDRLQRVLRLLQNRGYLGATTMEIIQQAGVCAVNSIVDELRENGQRIDGAWDPQPAGGEKAFRYRLIPPDASGGVQGPQGDLFRT